MSHPEVLGVVVLARNGDRTECYQDPITYQPGPTLSTPLGEVQSHQLGTLLRNTYLDTSNPSHVRGIATELVDLSQVHVRVKVGARAPRSSTAQQRSCRVCFPLTLPTGSRLPMRPL
ncbi:hypothetical protein AcW1_005150 [Taiwanofungus camphoratus]|nr:hypothetical protein AcW1_005150 [Antrodia cinnamomea]